MDVLVSELSNQGGPLAIMLAITLTALFTVVKLLLAEKDKRIEDATKVTSNIALPMQSIKESIERVERKILVSKGE